jgi:pimeloyl-ACP methyl ester carboxylesterase
MPYLTRDGVKLYYEEAGNGDETMLFVHGWTCNLSHFAPQVQHFAGRYRCVSIDLRGHGKSDAPEQAYTIHGFADDLAWMCGELGLARPIVIGHSMGGLTALILAAEHPELVRACVFVDAPLLLPSDALAARRPILESFWSRDYVNAAVAYANDRFFIDTDDPERRAHILECVATMPQHVLASAWQSILETDSMTAARAFGEQGTPGLYIGCARPLADLQQLRELCPQVLVAQTAGAGHFCQLEAPEQVNAMIDRFLKVAVA